MIRGFLSPIIYNEKKSKVIWLLVKDLIKLSLFIVWTSLALWCTITLFFVLTNGFVREVNYGSQIFTVLLSLVIIISYLYSLYYQFIESRPTKNNYIPDKYIALKKIINCKGFYLPNGVYYEIFTDIMDLIVEAVGKEAKLLFDEEIMGLKRKTIKFDHERKEVSVVFEFCPYNNYYWLETVMPNIYDILSKTKNRYYIRLVSIQYLTWYPPKDERDIKCNEFNTKIFNAFNIDYRVWNFENHKFKKSNEIKDWKSK